MERGGYRHADEACILQSPAGRAGVMLMLDSEERP
jgi:hypothetical protein